MESIRPLRPEDKGRTAEIYVFNNRLNYYPIFHDDDYSFGEMLWALEKNTRAIAFYARHGFAPTGERQYEEGTTEELIRLSLSRETERNG